MRHTLLPMLRDAAGRAGRCNRTYRETRCNLFGAAVDCVQRRPREERRDIADCTLGKAQNFSRQGHLSKTRRALEGERNLKAREQSLIVPRLSSRQSKPRSIAARVRGPPRHRRRPAVATRTLLQGRKRRSARTAGTGRPKGRKVRSSLLLEASGSFRVRYSAQTVVMEDLP